MTTEVQNVEFFAHFDQTIHQEIVDFANNTALLSSRYLFVERRGKQQYGYCTHCHTEYVTGYGAGYLSHGQSWQCMKCKSLVLVKASGRGRGKLIDEAYFVWYQKSLTNPKAIVARGLHVMRDYRQDYRRVETRFSTVALYVFEPGVGATMARYEWEAVWSWPKSVRSEMSNSMQFKNCHLAVESVVPAVQGTPFQYSMWSQYTSQSADLVKFFELAAKYPCVEYLTKLGFRAVVDAKVCGYNTHGAVNWRGKTIEKVLRLTKTEINAARSVSFPIDHLTLHSYRYHKRLGLDPSFEDASVLEELSAGYYHEVVFKCLDVASPAEISRYVLKQLRRSDHQYRDAHNVLSAWVDYCGECRVLGMDLTHDHVRFPNNLYTTHQKTTVKIKIKADESLNKKIAERFKKLQSYTFEFDGLFIRPAVDTIELFNEGKTLHHCVGSYSKNYASGQSDLFVVRRVEEPDTSYYTVEVIDKQIRQAYGMNNTRPTPEVQLFLDTFVAERLTKKKRNNRVRVSSEGVAV